MALLLTEESSFARITFVMKKYIHGHLLLACTRMLFVIISASSNSYDYYYYNNHSILIAGKRLPSFRVGRKMAYFSNITHCPFTTLIQSQQCIICTLCKLKSVCRRV